MGCGPCQQLYVEGNVLIPCDNQAISQDISGNPTDSCQHGNQDAGDPVNSAHAALDDKNNQKGKQRRQSNSKSGMEIAKFVVIQIGRESGYRASY